MSGRGGGFTNWEELNTNQWRRWHQLLTRNIQWVKQSAAPDLALELIEGFANGNIAMIVPPDMIDPIQLEAMIQRGRELAQQHGWIEP